MRTGYSKLTGMRLPLVALMSSALLGACAAPQKPLYYWGSYQTQVYGYFTGKAGVEEQIQALEADKQKARAEGLPLPPGYQAFLGMLYGVNGQADLQVQGFEAEKAQFPEATVYVDFLLKNARK